MTYDPPHVWSDGPILPDMEQVSYGPPTCTIWFFQNSFKRGTLHVLTRTTTQLPSWVNICRSSSRGQSSFHIQTTLFSVWWSKLELRSEYFERYCRNGLSFTQLKTYSWKLKMVYCKQDELIKTKDGLLKTEDNSKQDGLLQTTAHELRSIGPKFIPLLATRHLYLRA